jgi:hypothetical protein
VILELGCKHGLLGHVLPGRRTDYSLLPTGLSLHHRKLAHISNLGQGQDLVNVILCASSPHAVFFVRVKPGDPAGI